MKIRVELDVEPDEFELATELIATLKSITEHVKINSKPTVTESGSLRQMSPQNGPVQGWSERPVPAHRKNQSPAGQKMQAPAPQAPASFDFNSSFASLESALQNDPSQKHAIVHQIVAALPEKLESTEEKRTFQEFLTVFEASLWKPEAVENGQTIELCYLLPRVPEALKDTLKKSVISQAVKHLMMRRSLEVDRLEFFPQAETFAAMVKLEYVTISGAVQTIIQLLRKEETCAAAITMLGKTVELCADQVTVRCDAEKLAQLRSTLEEVQYEQIAYDRQYVMSMLGWEVPQNPGPSQDAPQPASTLPKLQPEAIWSNYTAQVRAVGLDEDHQQVVSITGDGNLYLHSFEGKELARYGTKQKTYVDMDYNANSRILVLVAMPGNTGTAARPLFLAYLVNPGSLQPIGRMTAPPSTTSVTKLRYLAKGSNTFCTAEAKADGSHAVSLYDSRGINSANDEILQPIRVIQTEGGLVTAISPVPASEQAFLTASKTGEVSVWQVSSPDPAATLLPSEAGGEVLNASVITSIEILANHLVLAGTYGQGISIWDLRGLQNSSRLKPCASIRLDEHVVTRLACFGDPKDRLCMVAAAQSIHTVKLNDDGTLAEKMEGQKASDKFYWDAKRSYVNSQLTFFAASAAGTLDVYSAV